MVRLDFGSSTKNIFIGRKLGMVHVSGLELLMARGDWGERRRGGWSSFWFYVLFSVFLFLFFLNIF